MFVYELRVRVVGHEMPWSRVACILWVIKMFRPTGHFDRDFFRRFDLLLSGSSTYVIKVQNDPSH